MPGAEGAEAGRRIAVVGAGIVGVACALELQRRGAQVLLIDRGDPGHETSFGNAGVLARSSLIPFNNPALWAALPTLARNRSAQLRYRAGFLIRHLPWLVGFLRGARASAFEARVTALDALIRLSAPEHRRLLGEAGELRRLRETGWIHLYRSEGGFERAEHARATYARFGIATLALDGPALHELEPALKPIFPRSLWIQDSASVDTPLHLVQAYARLFSQAGGQIVRAEVSSAQATQSSSWALRDTLGVTRTVSRVVLALGPWSAQFLRRCGLRVPMVCERGTHMHYAGTSTDALRRPVYDIAGGYVLSPMQGRCRLTTGVELADFDAPPNLAQLALAEQAARQAVDLGERLDARVWLGRRPTLPDSLPVIGEAPGRPGLWLAFGHQHVGLSTAPGTARLLGALMHGEPTPIDAAAFSPRRFLG